MAKKQFTKTCPTCGNVFVREHNYSTYCSHKCQPRTPSLPVLPRLMAKRQIAETGCWLWTGAKSSTGYGVINVNGRIESVHRASYEIFVGPIPEGKQIMHSCDTPLCFAVAHLSLSSQSENMRDMVSKGRGVNNSGSRHGMSKLTEERVAHIKARLSAGDRSVDIAADIGCSEASVCDIKMGRTWRHVA